MSDFLDMGGYALWVWSAYGFALLVILVMIGASLHLARSQRRAAERLEMERGRGRR